MIEGAFDLQRFAKVLMPLNEATREITKCNFSKKCHISNIRVWAEGQ